MNQHSEWPIRLEKYYMNASPCKLDLSTTSAVCCLRISATDPYFKIMHTQPRTQCQENGGNLCQINHWNPSAVVSLAKSTEY